MSLDLLFKTQKFTLQYRSFAKSKVTELANKIVLDEIHSTMRTKGFSEKIIENTFVKSVDVQDEIIDIEILSDYESESGFDISTAVEEGTRDHFIRPSNGKVLSWIQNGKRIFSRGHKVSGIKPEKIIEKTIKQKSRQLKSEWEKEQDKFFEEMVNGS